MRNFAETLKMLRERHNLSQRELADELNISKSSVGMYERGIREPNFEMLETIADYFNVDMNYLLGQKDTTTQILLPYPEATKLLNIYQPLSCGSGMFVDDNVITTISIPESMLPKGKKTLFGQYASGDSMIGKDIHDGDLLIFSKEDCSNGDVGCFCIDDNIATCKTLRIIGKQIMLMPANDKYEPIIVDPINFRCVGKLVLVIKKYNG